VYGRSGGGEPDDLPDLEEFQFHTIPDGMMERAKQILIILEMTEWQWTINDVLEQPEAELTAVFYLKAMGERIRAIHRYAEEESEPQTEAPPFDLGN
jgi:hypothetical protein